MVSGEPHGAGQGTGAVPDDGERRIAGRYRLIDTVGRGGMGVVWRAEDEVLGRTVAVKQVVIPPHLSPDEREVLRERVLREARAAARLHDPAAVTVFDVVEQDGSPYLVMELVDAATLAEVVRDEGPLPPREVARVGLAVLGALDAAHAAGIVHRDVKPGNVMVCPNGRVLLTDFGIASTQGDPSITQTGLLLGSPAYISPERARGEIGGPPADLWALGATLFTAVEGSPAYDGEGAVATLTAVVEGRRRPFRLAGPLAPVLDALLDSDPARRPTAPAARRMLEAVLSNGAGATVGTQAVPADLGADVGTTPREHTQVMPAAPLAPAYDDRPHVRTPRTPPPINREPGRRGPSRAVRRRRALALAMVALLVAGVAVVGGLAASGAFNRGQTPGLGSGTATVPASWTRYPDPTGWSIAYPPTWTRQSVPGGGIAFGANRTTYVRVTVGGAGSALAAMQGIDATKTGRPNGRPPLNLPAADDKGKGGDGKGGDGKGGDGKGKPGKDAGATAASPSAAASSSSDSPSPSPSPSASPDAASASAAAPSPSAAGLAGYQRLALEPTDGGDGSTSAKLEWREPYSGGRLHLLAQAKNDGGRLYTVLLVAPDDQWDALQSTFATITASFQYPR